MSKILIHAFPTEFGWAAIAGSEGQVARMNVPQTTREAAILFLSEGNGTDFVETEHDFSGEAERIAAYFAGERVQFQCELDFGRAGEFDRKVWSAAREIPYGEVTSYGDLAACIGKPGAARAVGQSLGRNPILVLVPCHRVLRSDGGLGGFGCGLHWKTRLLELERRK